MIARALRWTAIAIAAAGAIDPAVTLSLPARQAIAVVDVPSASLALPSSGMTRADRAAAVRDRLASRLGRDFDLHAAPGPSSAAMVVIGDRAPEDLDVPAGIRVWGVDLGGLVTPNVAVEEARAADTDVNGRVRVVSRIAASGMRGRTTTIGLMQGAISLAEQTHAWTADRETFDAVFEAAPTRAGLDALRVAAAADPIERTARDNERTLAVHAGVRRHAVIVYDARPSWSTSFLRRAIERDPAFHVEFLTRVSRGLAVRAGVPWSGAIDPAVLARFDVAIAGAPDALTRADASALERFARAGGSVVLVPDRRIEGPALDLIPAATLQERLLESPAAMALRDGVSGPRASEFLVARDPAPLAEVVATLVGDPAGPEGRASSPHSPAPVVLKSPLGRGHVYLDGALDAWRYRDDESRAYETFAADLVRDAASAALPPIAVTVAPRLVHAGGSAQATIRIRDAAQGSARVAAALIAPGGSTSPLRVWPSAEIGAFTATIALREIGLYTVRVSSGPGASDAQVLVRAEQDVEPDGSGALAAFVSAHGGTVCAPEAIDTLIAGLRAALPARREPRESRPMRSPWWIAPFAACLCGEWWSRRRRGLR